MLEPAALLRSVALVGLDYFAVSDHDTLAAYERHAAAFAPHAGRLVTGVEVSTSMDATEVHILGYNVGLGCAALTAILGSRSELRRQRAEKIIAKLNASGISISVEEVLRKTTGSIIGRPHIARVLVERGFAIDNDDAFTRFIGASGSAYVALSNLTAQQAIETIRECGGIAVLAHPGRNGVDVFIEELRRCGLQGIEAFSPSHTTHEAERFRALAQSMNLVITAGSDFHQPTASHPRPGVEIDEADFAPFLELLHK